MECRFNISEQIVTVQTIIHHNLEETIVANTETIDTALRYAATKKQISNLKKDNKCSQSIRVRCHYTNNDQDNIWIGDNGKQFHTTLGESTGGCSCPFVNKCEEGKTKYDYSFSYVHFTFINQGRWQSVKAFLLQSQSHSVYVDSSRNY